MTPPIISHAMVLAAGLGERMRPLTDNTPKPLLQINGRALIDHAIDRLEETGISHIVVNTFYLAEKIEAHLSARPGLDIKFSREPRRLETGGGVLNALALLGDEPFYVINSDALWLNGATDTLGRMAEIWDATSMDALLLLHATDDAYGYNGRGDFLIHTDNRLTRGPHIKQYPHMFAGIQILHPRLFAGLEDKMFSLNMIYDRAMADNRLFGMVHDGRWYHAGTPQALQDISQIIKDRDDR